jgi:hypothetical protein
MVAASPRRHVSSTAGLRPRRRLVALGLLAGLLFAGACSDGDGIDEEVSSAPDPGSAPSTSTLDDIALPGEDGSAVSPNPATSATAETGVTTTSEQAQASAAAAPTTSPGTATTDPSVTPTTGPTVPAAPATIAPPAPGGGAPPPPAALSSSVYGPLALVNSGAAASTFTWEQTASSDAGDSTTSVSWAVDGPNERVEVSDDTTFEEIVRVGSEYWMLTAEGVSQRVSEAEYLNVRRQWLSEPFATGVAAVLPGLQIAGAGRYEVDTSDRAVIGRVLGGQPPAGSTLRGSVQLDEAGRIVVWDIFVLLPSPLGTSGETSVAVFGQLAAGTDGPITAP